MERNDAVHVQGDVDATLYRTKRTFKERIDVWRDTQRRVLADERLRPAVPSTKVRYEPALAPARRTGVVVENMDSIDCGLEYKRLGHDPVVLNLADDLQAGGCVDIGSGAQEESIFRRTSLFATLSQSLYPVGDDEGVYSPDVAVIRASEAEGWRLYREPVRLAFLSVPGVKYPACDYPNCNDGPARLKQKDEARLRTKVRTMLQIAERHGHDVVVLGASGCGAWKCPAEHVAEIFRDVVEEYRGVFRSVVFAVLKQADDQAAMKAAMGIEDNYDVFRRVMHRPH